MLSQKVNQLAFAEIAQDGIEMVHAEAVEPQAGGIGFVPEAVSIVLVVRLAVGFDHVAAKAVTKRFAIDAVRQSQAEHDGLEHLLKRVDENPFRFGELIMLQSFIIRRD